ncbi:MAG: hypothetical protein QXD60_01030 [Nanopusillaceae archaeon]
MFIQYRDGRILRDQFLREFRRIMERDFTPEDQKALEAEVMRRQRYMRERGML